MTRIVNLLVVRNNLLYTYKHMKKNSLYRAILLIGLTALPVIAYAQGAEAQLTGGIGSFANIVDKLRTSLIAALISMFAAAGMAVFFFGIVKYLIGIRDGDKGAIDSGNKFMIWGLVALFVMFSVWGIITFAQGVFGIQGKTNIIIPSIQLQGSSNTSNGSGNTSSLPTGGSGSSGGQSFRCEADGGIYYDYNYYIAKCRSAGSGNNTNTSNTSQTGGAYIGADCTVDSECGGSLICKNFTCQQPTMSATVGANCTTDAECGGSLVCKNFTCQQQ